ncbi:MAG TPA: tRNA preQ1(34) S-adenosylmethionine ribosyltransferase-isomerase QueA [Candidatus Xenobia bacterium]|jgi:S-adenosylmethionine:tRNA ribosyltransferase-isomerase
MRLSDFQFEVPPELVAQRPAQPRDMSRLMCLRRDTGEISHHRFRDLPALLDESYTLVVNDSRVIRARLWGRYAGRRVEVFLLKELGDGRWSCLPDEHAPLPAGAVVLFDNSALQATVVAPSPDGSVEYRFSGAAVLEEAERIGEVPLPPYVQDASGAPQYQTVYAQHDGSVAAPTAGLHFTPEVLDALHAKGVARRTVTLHVSYGTFATVKTEDLDQHRMQTESFHLTPECASLLMADKRQGKRILAVGTTSTRVLETCSREDGTLVPQTGETSLFIRPPYRFKFVDALLTNFHMPGLTPIMLTSAMAGHELTLRAYRIAVEQRYRFYSFGDSMLIL